MNLKINIFTAMTSFIISVVILGVIYTNNLNIQQQLLSFCYANESIRHTEEENNKIKPIDKYQSNFYEKSGYDDIGIYDNCKVNKNDSLLIEHIDYDKDSVLKIKMYNLDKNVLINDFKQRLKSKELNSAKIEFKENKIIELKNLELKLTKEKQFFKINVKSKGQS